MWLFALLIGLPLIEIGLYVTLGAWLGLWVTLAIVLGTAALGVTLLRRMGLRSGDQLRQTVRGQQNPGGFLADRGLLAVAAVLLILPGFLTDFCGALLLIGPLRRLIGDALAWRLRAQVVAGAGRMAAHGAFDRRQGMAEPIDATWEELPPDDRPRPPSGWTRH